ncbi:MAG: cation:proton antiporter [Oligoflexia bacterium]|nr:cation:proton antiporter [Oligoflexia bacterium]
MIRLFFDNYEVVYVLLIFLLISLSSKEIGVFFKKIKLPLITGFIFAGVITGPYILNIITADAVKNLYFIDWLSLAFIAFAAGSELHLKELRARFRSIKFITIGQVASAFILSFVGVLLLSHHIPFLKDSGTNVKISASLLAAAILVARSPSSAIAVIKELRARGPFTQTTLSVTVIMDIVVIIIFSINSSVADFLISGLSLDFKIFLEIFFSIFISLLSGIVLSVLLRSIMWFPVARWLRSVLLLLSGYLVFWGSSVIKHNPLPAFDIFVEPLLVCMIGSFLLINFSSYRRDFLDIMHRTGPGIYIVFFTLTGASIELDILNELWLISIILVSVRIVAIFVGSFAGGIKAGDPMDFNKYSWMAYVTQAGVGLGLAKEVAVEFPGWGSSFATLMISVIVINQIIGPVLHKWVLNIIGEAHTRAKAHDNITGKNTVIFGRDGRSLALARQLRSHGWQVRIVTDEKSDLRKLMDPEFEIIQLKTISVSIFKKLGVDEADVIVTMMSDEQNYSICELVYEHFGKAKLVVLLEDRVNYEHFNEFGASIVCPSTAMISLLDHFVRSPSATSLLLGMEHNQEVMEFEFGNASLEKVNLKEMNLPVDVHILSVERQKHKINISGNFRFRVGDIVTVIGSPGSLDEVMVRFFT